MKIESVSAVLFYSAQPARLAEFYRTHFGIPFELDRHGAIREHLEADLGDVHLAVLKGHAPDGNGGGVAITFRVRTLDAFLEKLERSEIAPIGSVLDLGEGKRVATFRDPDGNSFNLIEIGS
jgi:predicted enzyme related to lactoylglutathione lyase